MLKWIVDRCHGCAAGQETALGWVPRPEDLNWEGLNGFTPAMLAQALRIDRQEWTAELDSPEEFLQQIGPRLPRELVLERELLRLRL